MTKVSTITSLVALLLIVSACSDRKAQTQQQGPQPVEVAKPMVDSVTLYNTYPAFLGADYVVDVVCQVNGRLLSKNYKSDDYVTKGQVLFTIDPTTYRNAVAEAQAQLDNAQSSYEFYSKQYAAMQRALEADAVSQMDVIQAKSNLDRAEASIAQAKAALSTARTRLGYCTVTAPISGYIGSGTMDVGNFVAGEAQPVKLSTIYDDRELIVSFSIEDSQFEKLLAGKTDNAPLMIPLTFNEELPHKYVAKLYYVDVTVNKQTGTLTLKAHVENPYRELKNGMYVTAALPYGTDAHALLVNDASISTDQAGKYLYTVNDSNRVVYTPVKVGGLYRDSLRIVTQGLTPDSRYVTSALLKVRDGMTVDPVPAK